jgi:RecA/RadA recombinase
MSASHRKLSRLPLSIFDNLSSSVEESSSEVLKTGICRRLKRFPIQSGKTGISISCSIKTIGDLFRANKRTLLYALDPLLTFSEIEFLLERIYKLCAASPTNALALLQTTEPDLPSSSQSNAFGDRLRYLPTGLTSLDRHLGGGIRVGTVTEIVGRAGAGKSQLALQLCIWAAKYNQGSLYIDTERKIALERLSEMSQQRAHPSSSCQQNNHNTDSFSYHDDSYSASRQYQQPNSNSLSPLQDQKSSFFFKSPKTCLANLTVESPSIVSELFETLDAAEEVILHRQQQTTDSKFPIRLLILDSIAAPMKRDFGSDSAPQRSAAIFTCAQTLKRLAESLHLAIVVINQVGQGSFKSNNNGTVAVKAALGTSWHHCVSTRVFLEQYDSDTDNQSIETLDNNNTNFSKSSRRISVVKSNVAPLSTSYFLIDNRGLVEDPSRSTSDEMGIESRR